MSPKITALILLVLSFVLILRLVIHFQNIQVLPQGAEIAFEGKILNQPKISVRGQQTSLILPNSQRVTVRFPLDPILRYGDRVKVRGKIEYFESENGNLVAFMNYPQFELVEKGTDASLILIVRENIIKFYNLSLGPSSSSLIMGITFGIKQEMPEEFYLNFQKTGLMHVVAGSGMNVTMVGGFLAGFFSLFLRRQLALILSIFGILFYAVLAGLEASIVRASIMGIIVFSAQIMGRQSMAALGLLLAGFFMLMKAPGTLLDIGFQLSFLATAGLIYIRPIFFLSSKLKTLIQKSLIGEDFVTTLAAQLATLPILLVNFGSYSLWSVPANAILLWTVPPLMIIGGVSAVLGIIFEPLGRLILYLALPFLIYFEGVVNFLGERITPVSISTFPLTIIAGYYLLISAVIIRLRYKK